MKYLKKYEMFDVKVIDMKHTPSSRKQLGLDKNDEEAFQNYLTNKDDEESNVCTKCDCIPCQCTGEEPDQDEDLKEGLENFKEGTFAYYNAMSPEELKSLQKTFKHDFDNPAQHDPKFVAYLKACELKKVFTGKDQTPKNLKQNKIY